MSADRLIIGTAKGLLVYYIQNQELDNKSLLLITDYEPELFLFISRLLDFLPKLKNWWRRKVFVLTVNNTNALKQ